MFRRLLTAAVVVLAVFSGTPAGAVPFQTASFMDQPFSVALCKASDDASEPRAKEYLSALLGNSGYGLGEYLGTMSGGAYGYGAASVLGGWYTVPMTRAEITALPTRTAKINACRDAAEAAGFYRTGAHHVMSVYNVEVGDYGTDNDPYLRGVLVTPSVLNLGFLARESLRALGLDSAWSNHSTWWNNWGEGDNPWDTLGTSPYLVGGHYLSPAPAGLNAFHRDKFGWIARDRILSFGAGGPATGTVTLSWLGSPAGNPPVLVRVPISASDPAHYYTVEFRSKARNYYDSGIPNDVVLIHEIQNNTSTLIRQNGVSGRPPATLVDNTYVRINVDGIDGPSARVSITTKSQAVTLYGPNTCKSGYVWREASLTDYVCVTPGRRAEVSQQNATAASRWLPGSRYCTEGYFWREAYYGDVVCVPRTSVSQVYGENLFRANKVEQS